MHAVRMEILFQKTVQRDFHSFKNRGYEERKNDEKAFENHMPLVYRCSEEMLIFRGLT